MGKRIVVAFAVTLSLLGGSAFAMEDIAEYPKCKHSGMERGKFAHSRMLIEYEDGSSSATGSLRCSALDLALNFYKTPESVMVGDFYTKELIEAQKAYWVIGGKQKGVMAQKAKWAFEKKEDALNFISENGGELADYETALRTAYSDMHADTSVLYKEMQQMSSHGHGHGHQHGQAQDPHSGHNQSEGEKEQPVRKPHH